jgi:hypothetical protein
MTRLEDLQPNATVKGILPDSLVTVVTVQWYGNSAVELTYKTTTGKVANELLYRHDLVALGWGGSVGCVAKFRGAPMPACSLAARAPANRDVLGTGDALVATEHHFSSLI